MLEVEGFLAARVDPRLGAEREWAVFQIAEAHGWPEWRVSAAVSALVSERRARAASIDGVAVVYPAGGGTA
jgi:hypothetical protein